MIRRSVIGDAVAVVIVGDVLTGAVVGDTVAVVIVGDVLTGAVVGDAVAVVVVGDMAVIMIVVVVVLVLLGGIPRRALGPAGSGRLFRGGLSQRADLRIIRVVVVSVIVVCVIVVVVCVIVIVVVIMIVVVGRRAADEQGGEGGERPAQQGSHGSTSGWRPRPSGGADDGRQNGHRSARRCPQCSVIEAQGQG